MKISFKLHFRLMFPNTVSQTLNRLFFFFLLMALDNHQVAQVTVAVLHKYN